MNLNDLAYWYPPLVDACLPTPKTIIVKAPPNLIDLLDGQTPEGWFTFVNAIRRAGNDVGWPCFLRTGHGSGKHDWSDTCYVTNQLEVPRHVAALVEWSALVDLLGLPTENWAVRELIPTHPLTICQGYKGFPVVREFRFFVNNGWVEHMQPYWPPDAVAAGDPTGSEWRQRLRMASRLSGIERERLANLALRAVAAVGGGYWSVDLLQDEDGDWWVTDMALGEQSYRYEPEDVVC